MTRVSRAKIVTLCGSTKFKAQFEEANRLFTLWGAIVLAPGVFGHVDPDPTWMEWAKKEELDALHLEKIRMSDEVYVIDVDGYIGESATREIAYAKSRGVPVFYWSRGNQ